MATLLVGTQSRWRDCYAPAAVLGLSLRCNGEEKVKVFDGGYSFFEAYIAPPTVTPTVAAGSAGGDLTSGKRICYRYVYAATTAYPFVENAVTAGGSVAPRSNPSERSAEFTITGSGKAVVTVTGTTREDIDKIWIYRTNEQDTNKEARDRADAGDMYFVAAVNNPNGGGTTTYTDDGSITPVEQLELDNLPTPQFQFCVFDGIYFWGFGGHTYRATVTLDGTSLMTLTGTDRWFDGRDGQFVTLLNVTSGGADGRGTFFFKWLSPTTAQLSQDQAGTIPLSSYYTGTTPVTITGYPTTLYRSKPRNPFSWGWTELQIGSDGSIVRVPQTWAYKVGGGTGVALAIIPHESVLKCDMEEPALAVTFNLNNAESPVSFGSTRQKVSEKFTVDAHFSQFSATTPDGQSPLRGVDAKSFAILEANSQSQVPVSGEVFQTLRHLHAGGTDAHFFHGVYDHFTELNVWWVRSLGAVTEPVLGDLPAPITPVIDGCMSPGAINYNPDATRDDGTCEFGVCGCYLVLNFEETVPHTTKTHFVSGTVVDGLATFTEHPI